MNKCIFKGNLVRKPEVRQTNSGKAVATFTIAINEGYGDKKSTQYANCVAWGKLAETCEKYLDKGSAVLVDSRYSNRSYEAQDGTKKWVTEFIVQDVEFLGGNKREGSEATAKFGYEVSEEIPF